MVSLQCDGWHRMVVCSGTLGSSMPTSMLSTGLATVRRR
jgi:hypothetical protein